MIFLKPLAGYVPGQKQLSSGRETNLHQNQLRILDSVKTRHRELTFHMNNKHPLVKLLGMFAIITDDDLDRYLSAVDLSMRFAGILGWFGTPHQARISNIPYFFNDQMTPEAVIYHNRPESYQLVIDYIMKRKGSLDWRDWEPIRVRNHVYTDLDYCVMGMASEERFPSIENGMNLIEVDIPLLYMQYYYWAKSEEAWVEDQRKTRGAFLLSYPLANALRSQMGIAFYNRVYCHAMGYTIYGNNRLPKWMPPLPSYYLVDDVIRTDLSRLKKYGGVDFTKLLRNIPRCYPDFEVGEVWKRKDIFLSNSSMMLLCYSVLSLYEFWIKIVKDHQLQRYNKTDIAEIKFGIRLLYQGGMMKVLSARHAPFVFDRLKKFEEQVGLSV